MTFKLTDKQKLSAAISISSVFFFCELGVAYKTSSLALMADAFHYLNDLIGFVVTFGSIVISEKTEYRQDFSFGWQRARLLGAFFNGSFLLALGISIFLQSIERFISLKQVEDAKLILIMGCMGLALNIITAVFLHDHHHHHHHHHDHHDHHRADQESETSSGVQISSIHLTIDRNEPSCRLKSSTSSVDCHADHRHAKHSLKAPGRDLAMLGALLHVIGDALNNVGVIIAAAIIWFTRSPRRFYADPAVGMAISLMILGSAWPLVKHSGEILLQSAPRGVKLGDIKHDIEKIPGILSVHELHVWRLDQHKSVASAHVVVSDPDVAAFMARARTIGECLHAYGIHSATLQPELLLVPMAAAAHPQVERLPPPLSSSSSVAAVSRLQRRNLSGGAGEEEEAATATTTAISSGGGDGEEPATAAATCQIVCGKGMCGHLMCCTSPVQA